MNVEIDCMKNAWLIFPDGLVSCQAVTGHPLFQNLFEWFQFLRVVV